MTAFEAFAHTAGPDGTWHGLVEHLLGTAQRAREFGNWFAAGDLAYWLGLWHDLGKFNPKFQDYLRAQGQEKGHLVAVERVPHAIWGAALAYQLLSGQSDQWKEIALPIQGHHAGIANGGTAAQDIEDFLSRSPEALSNYPKT